MLQTCGTLLNVAVALLGLYAIVRAELPLAPNRHVTEGMARLVGILFIVSAVLAFFEQTLAVSGLILIAALVLGWTMGRPIRR